MGFAKKFNKGVRFTVDTEGFEFKKLQEEFEKGNKHFVVRGMFMTQPLKYGKMAVLITNDEFLALPAHMNETIVNMLGDAEVEEVCNNSKLGCEIVTYKYMSKDVEQIGYSVIFKDL